METLTETKGNYPKNYQVKNIEDQIQLISSVFGLYLTYAKIFSKNLKKLTKAKGPEAYFAIPKISAVAGKYFPEIKDEKEKYYNVTNFILSLLAKSLGLSLENKEEILKKCSMSKKTSEKLLELESIQEGDILIIPAQFGKYHAGKTTDEAISTFADNEFGLDIYILGCMLLTHPERKPNCKELSICCTGNEIESSAFKSKAIPTFFLNEDNNLDLGVTFKSHCSSLSGNPTGFTF